MFMNGRPMNGLPSHLVALSHKMVRNEQSRFLYCQCHEDERHGRRRIAIDHPAFVCPSTRIQFSPKILRTFSGVVIFFNAAIRSG
jgi:hypothetical protein